MRKLGTIFSWLIILIYIVGMFVIGILGGFLVAYVFTIPFTANSVFIFFVGLLLLAITVGIFRFGQKLINILTK